MAPAVADVGVGVNAGVGIVPPDRVPTARPINTNDNATNHATKKMSFRLMGAIVVDFAAPHARMHFTKVHHAR